jgi:predicted anti-sigma-YlaC factor YlaD
MNHRPFEEYLLTEEPLTVEQSRQLHEHLLTCDRCRQLETGWGEVQRLIHTTSQVTPQTGFASRWHERLAAQRTRRHRRQLWLSFSITASIAAILLILLGIQIWTSLRTPEQWLLVKAYFLSITITIVDIVEALGDAIFEVSERFSLTPWLFVIGTGGLLYGLRVVIGRQKRTSED